MNPAPTPRELRVSPQEIFWFSGMGSFLQLFQARLARSQIQAFLNVRIFATVFPPGFQTHE
jgi:hypothetical protein